MYKAGVNCGVLKQCLDSLIQHNLVEGHTLHQRGKKTSVVYAITERGLAALRNAMEINNALQINDEADFPRIAMLGRSQNPSYRNLH
jgi:DNA-binding PadR family transcriptional regulator